MSLQTRLGALITAIGADIKTLQSRVGPPSSASIALQTIADTDQYVTGSAVAIPQGKIKAGTFYRCKLNVIKTAAGVVAPIFTVRVGIAGALSDTAVATLNGYSVQTGVADEGVFEFDCIFRQSGATAVIQTMYTLLHRRATTGLGITAAYTMFINTGGSFDVTGANLKIGVSANPGTSASWAVNVVTAELLNLTP